MLSNGLSHSIIIEKYNNLIHNSTHIKLYKYVWLILSTQINFMFLIFKINSNFYIKNKKIYINTVYLPYIFKKYFQKF